MKNRSKRLDLIDTVPDELQTEVHDIVQETGIKTIPVKKKVKSLSRVQLSDPMDRKNTGVGCHCLLHIKY